MQLTLGSLFFAMSLALAAVVAGLAVPLFYGSVRPNKLDGFRIPQTLQDPEAWYPANRTCGFWLIVTGVITTGVASGLFAAGVEAHYALFFTLVALLTGVIVMAVQSDAAARRRVVAGIQTQYRLLALFIVTTLVAIGCAVARLPVHWAFKTGILFAYVTCVVGLLGARHRDAGQSST